LRSRTATLYRRIAVYGDKFVSRNSISGTFTVGLHLWSVVWSFGSVFSVVCLPSGYCVTKTGFCSVESDPCPPFVLHQAIAVRRVSRANTSGKFLFCFSRASGSTLRPTQPPSLREPEIFIGRC